MNRILLAMFLCIAIVSQVMGAEPDQLTRLPIVGNGSVVGVNESNQMAGLSRTIGPNGGTRITSFFWDGEEGKHVVLSNPSEDKKFYQIVARGISRTGIVVGAYQGIDDTDVEAFGWDSKTRDFLQLPSIDSAPHDTTASAINKFGNVIAGMMKINHDWKPCIWKLKDGKWIAELLPFEGTHNAKTDNMINGISSDGRFIAGKVFAPFIKSGNKGVTKPCVWELHATGWKLKVLPSRFEGEAFSANSKGEVVGWLEIKSVRTPCVWTKEGVELIKLPQETRHGKAHMINEESTVVGYMAEGYSDGETDIAFVWDRQNGTRKMFPSGAISRALCINDGNVVGVSYYPDDGDHAEPGIASIR